MEVKKSIVTQVAGIGHWDGQYGRMYKFEVSFENGDAGQYLSKVQDQTKFIQGREAEYQKETNDKGYVSIKPFAPQPNYTAKGPVAKDPETGKQIARMSVLKAACDLVVAGKVELHDITHVASIFERYVQTGEDSMKSVYAAAQPKKMGNIEQKFMDAAVDQMANDLPF